MPTAFRDKPYYDSKSISSLDALSSTLDIRPSALIDLSKNSQRHYHSFNFATNSGKVRQLNDPKFHLKKIQKRINSRIFSNILFPQYLHGGIKERDYYSNAATHTKAEFIFSFDIKNYYNHITKPHAHKIFKYLCHFSEDVSDILSSLVTLENKVPQGGVTSSNIANLVFFDDEYKLVSKFRKRNLTYTRLLDDIVISSSNKITAKDKTKIARDVIAFVTKNGFKLNDQKTHFISRNQPDQLMNVTGLWVNHSNPKCSKVERKKIRAAVHDCEKLFARNSDTKTTDEYHKLWNTTSGRVAMLSRLGHPQSIALRNRLKIIFPTVSEEVRKNLHREVTDLEKLSNKSIRRFKNIKKINKTIYFCGVLSRTHKKEARQLRKRLINISFLKSYAKFWEE